MFWTVSWDCVWGFVRLRPAVECHQLARFPNCSLSMDKPASHDQWHAHFSFNLLGCHAATICNGSQGEPVSRPEDSRLPDEKDPFWVGAPLRSVNVSAFESRRRWFTEPSALWMVEVDYYPKNMDDVSGPGFLLIISVLLHVLIGTYWDHFGCFLLLRSAASHSSSSSIERCLWPWLPLLAVNCAWMPLLPLLIPRSWGRNFSIPGKSLRSCQSLQLRLIGRLRPRVCSEVFAVIADLVLGICKFGLKLGEWHSECSERWTSLQ